MSTRNILLLLLLLWLAVGIGCGDESVCEEGCNKQKECAQQLECQKSDPLGTSSCQRTKDSLTSVDCSKLSVAGVCSGSVEENYQLIRDCSLNPTTCSCAN